MNQACPTSTTQRLAGCRAGSPGAGSGRCSVALGGMWATKPACTATCRQVGVAYPRSNTKCRCSCSARAGTAMTTASNTSASFWLSWRLAPHSTTASGIPLASVRRVRLQPALPRSVGLLPVASGSPEAPFFPVALSRCCRQRLATPSRSPILDRILPRGGPRLAGGIHAPPRL